MKKILTNVNVIALIVAIILCVIFSISYVKIKDDMAKCDTEMEITYIFVRKDFSSGRNAEWYYIYNATYYVNGIEYNNSETLLYDNGKYYTKTVKLNSNNPEHIYDVEELKYSFPKDAYIVIGAMYIMFVLFCSPKKENTDEDLE